MGERIEPQCDNATMRRCDNGELKGLGEVKWMVVIVVVIVVVVVVGVV